ncbi:hypothetical protein AVEN_34298-1 [Araneus ventricosus]|uniref:Uncharacterized protein n=1 Tax=Araneus ventricosus TaxID=182803 RepID=A0A4Y2KFK8_ARAVE|nr:hypothetical protein AVEN_34298-1 [Araneus ventricosus]
MVWTAVCFNIQTSLAIIKVENNLKTTNRHFASDLVLFVDIFGGTDLTFQHDNPSINTSKLMSRWLSSNMGWVLSGLALSPDLNFIGNMWGKFTNLVYQNSMQDYSVEVLELAIEDVWFELQP